MVSLVTVMLVALALQVVMRYAFGQALSWSEELALLCFSWSSLLAIALGVRDAVHVRLDLLVVSLPGTLARWLDKLQRSLGERTVFGHAAERTKP